MKKILITLLGIFPFAMSFAQTDLEHKAPTLQIGLDGLSLSKGVLDYEVIMQIVSEKKNELKLKTIQNLFLKKIDGAGGLTYSYVDNILKAIIFEQDPNLRKKIVLENTVNVVFAASFAEYYFRTNNFKDKDYLKDMAGYGLLVDNTSQNSLLKSLILQDSLKNNPDVAKSPKEAVDQIKKAKFIVMLLDIASECVREDATLKRLGLMQVSYSAGYEFKNVYRQLIRKDNQKHNPVEVKAAKEIHNSMKIALSKITNVIGLVKYLADDNTFRNSDLTILDKDTLKDKGYSKTNLLQKLQTANIGLDAALMQISENINDEDSIGRQQVATIIRVKNYLKKAEAFVDNAKELKDNNATVFSDILYSVSKEFIPAMEEVAYKYPKILQLTDTLRDVSSELAKSLSSQFNISEINSAQIRPFIILVSKLYEFDRASTYSDYLSYVNDLVDLIPNESVKNVYSNVNTFVKDYTVIHLNEKGKEVIEFNIESFLVKLQTIKKERYNPFEFHFTVGVNTGYFYKPLTYKDETLNSFSSVSEKIGLKIKLADFKFTNFRDPGDTYKIFGTKWVRRAAPVDPLISNIHLLVYGSGLLYSILNTSTNKTFDAPLVGTGIGFTFINALDLNFSVSVPVLNDRAFKTALQNPLFNIGFDVQIGEYLSRIGSKKVKKASTK